MFFFSNNLFKAILNLKFNNNKNLNRAKIVFFSSLLNIQRNLSSNQQKTKTTKNVLILKKIPQKRPEAIDRFKKLSAAIEFLEEKKLL